MNLSDNEYKIVSELSPHWKGIVDKNPTILNAISILEIAAINGGAIHSRKHHQRQSRRVGGYWSGRPNLRTQQEDREMTIEEALSLTAKPIPEDLAQNFFGTMRAAFEQDRTLDDVFFDWCETHKARLEALHAEPSEEVHNPDGLDESTVGTGNGWRLLNKNEIKEGGPFMNEIEIWYKRCGWDAGWSGAGWSGESIKHTYRTRLTPEELAAKRKESK